MVDGHCGLVVVVEGNCGLNVVVEEGHCGRNAVVVEGDCRLRVVVGGTLVHVLSCHRSEVVEGYGHSSQSSSHT